MKTPDKLEPNEVKLDEFKEVVKETLLKNPMAY